MLKCGRDKTTINTLCEPPSQKYITKRNQKPIFKMVL